MTNRRQFLAGSTQLAMLAGLSGLGFLITAILGRGLLPVAAKSGTPARGVA